MQRDAFVDFARGFSILTIVLYHYLAFIPLPGFLAKAALLGGSGVHVFLFISGYGLSLSAYKGWWFFIKKRFFKVLIPYYIGIIFIFSINIIFHLYREGFEELLSHLFLYKMFFNGYTRSFGGQFWFISTIIQFYLAFPLLLKLYTKIGPRNSLLTSIFISFCYSLLVVYLGKVDERQWSRFFLQYLWEFVLGMVIARNQLLAKFLNYRWFYYLIALVVSLSIALLCVVVLGEIGKILNDYFTFLGYLCGCILLYLLGKNYAIWIVNFIRWIEGFSYSLFIMHMLVLDFYRQILVHRPLSLIDLPILLIASFAVSLIFNKLISYVLNLKMLQSAPTVST